MGFLSSIRQAFSRSRQGPLRVGLIGTGVAAERIHVPTLRKLGTKFEIAGCCSSSHEGARQFASEHGIARAYRDMDQLIQDPSIEVVVAAVPIPLNVMVVEKVLKAKKHLLIEKPIATSPRDARALADLAQRSTTVSMVAENVLYWPVLDAVKTRLENNFIGSPSLVVWNSVQHVSQATLPDWRTQPSYPYGYLLESGIHLISALRYLFGPIRVVGAHTETLFPGLGQGDFMNVTLANDSNLRIAITFLRTPFEQSVSDNRCTIIGSEGKIIFSSNRYLIRALDTERDISLPGDLGYQEEYEDLYRAIREGGTPRSTMERACEDLELLWDALTWTEKNSSEGQL
jgi:predicted dehydrogenase